MLRIENLKKVFGKTVALDGLNMLVQDGALYGFVGPNGAGKTTTIRTIIGLLTPDEGSVAVDGVYVDQSPKKVMSKIGYVPDSFGVYDNLKVSEYMEFFAACYGITGLKARKRNETLLEQVGLYDKADFYVEGLSRGMKQRLCLARALIHNPLFLIMDEPTAGLDPRTRYEFKEILKELCAQGKTILISSHILPELSEICTDIGVVDQGRMVFEGSMEEILSQINVACPILISIAGDQSPALRILREHSQVETVTIRGDDILVGFRGDKKDETALLQRLVEAGVQIYGFMRERRNLETVFMQITDRGGEEVVLSYES